MKILVQIHSNPDRNKVAQKECHLLKLPPELRLNIAHFLLSKDHLTFVNDEGYSSLISLASRHCGLRRICISAGLFRRVTPNNAESFKHFKKFGDSLYIRRITSLRINLGNRKVELLCAHARNAILRDECRRILVEEVLGLEHDDQIANWNYELWSL